MPTPQANGHSHDHRPSRGEGASGGNTALGGTGLGALVEEAQALKAALHDPHGRSPIRR